MKQLLFLIFTVVTLNSFAQKQLVYAIVEDQTTGQIRTLNPSTDSLAIVVHVTDSFPGGKKFLTASSGMLKSAVKISTPYSGTTNASGNYTVTFPVAYAVAPNIQVCLINPNVRDTPVPTVTTTGFTVNVQRRTDVVGLLPTYANVNGASVDVLITEK